MFEEQLPRVRFLRFQRHRHRPNGHGLQDLREANPGNAFLHQPGGLAKAESEGRKGLVTQQRQVDRKHKAHEAMGNNISSISGCLPLSVFGGVLRRTWRKKSTSQMKDFWCDDDRFQVIAIEVFISVLRDPLLLASCY